MEMGKQLQERGVGGGGSGEAAQQGGCEEEVEMGSNCRSVAVLWLAVKVNGQDPAGRRRMGQQRSRQCHPRA